MSKQTNSHVILTGLAKRFVHENLLAETKMQAALQASKAGNTSLVSHLVKENLIPAKKIASSVSNYSGLPLFDIEVFDTDLIPKNIIDDKTCREKHILPLYQRESQLFLAVSDPTNVEIINELRFRTKLSIHSIVVEDDKLTNVIDKLLNANDLQNYGEVDDSGLEDLAIISEETDNEQEEVNKQNDDVPIVRFVNKILLDAVNLGVSDLHFEPYEKKYRIRFRLDGMLHEIASPPVSMANRMASRLKVMSSLDISERRVPQDGRFKLALSRNRAIDFRISTCPTVNGEKVVMRILDQSNASIGITGLGMEKRERELLLDCIQKSQGMVLVTGPTGSGKTVTLYTALELLNNEERNISTIEDPVELHVTGINQVNINPKANLDFSAALRSFLRQDPDIIMVGEIRDKETAEIAIKAAQTGHLVLSTLHTNSAPETLTRLQNMGIASFNIATSVSLIVAQRLARRLCEFCKKTEDVPKESLLQEGFSKAELDNLTVYTSVGCSHCQKGYAGRVGLYEVLHVSEKLAKAIMAGNNAIELKELACNEGMKTLRQAGLAKVAAGITSLKEINRITKN